MRNPSEHELIAACRQGNKPAMTELFGRYYAGCLRVAQGILRSEDQSQDAVQLAYFSAFRHFRRFRGDSSFKTWITRIVINQCLMLLRQARRQPGWVSLDDSERATPAITLVSAAPTPERSVLSEEIGAAISNAVERLPDPMREMFTLCEISGLSVKEAATRLGITIPAAKTRLFRAQVRVRSSLKVMSPLVRDLAA